jgi:hypothetical protein
LSIESVGGGGTGGRERGRVLHSVTVFYAVQQSLKIHPKKKVRKKGNAISATFNGRQYDYLQSQVT